MAKTYKSKKARKAGSQKAFYGDGPVDAGSKSVRRQQQKRGQMSRTGGGGRVTSG